MNDDTHPHLQVKRTVRALNRMVQRAIKAAGTHSLATVSATGPLTVTLDGATTATPAVYFPGYTPAVGDRVWCDIVNGQVLVRGKPLT